MGATAVLCQGVTRRRRPGVDTMRACGLNLTASGMLGEAAIGAPLALLQASGTLDDSI